MSLQTDLERARLRYGLAMLKVQGLPPAEASAGIRRCLADYAADKRRIHETHNNKVT